MGDLQAQSLSVRENRSIVQKLFQMASGDIMAPMRALIDVAKVRYDLSAFVYSYEQLRFHIDDIGQYIYTTDTYGCIRATGKYVQY